MDYATWDELRRDIIEYGGSLVTLLRSREHRRRAANLAGNPGPSFGPVPITGPVPFPEWPLPYAQSPTPASTGPP
jgi:hypothetical protein